MSNYPEKSAGLEVTEVADGFMIHEPEKDRVHYLNHTAVLVLEMCTGDNSPEEIAETLAKTYGLEGAPESEVRQILNNMIEEGLVTAGSRAAAPHPTTH